MTKHLLRDLDNISNELLRLTNEVEEALSQALNCLMARDPAAAEAVIEGDAAIDRLEVELEESSLKLLALHQPVAGDLRFVIAAIKINNDLERIADIAANLAKRAQEISGMSPVEPPARIEDMADIVRKMVRDAIQSLIKRDTAVAQRVRELDDQVDDYEQELLDELQGRLEAGQPGQAGPLMRWVTAVRGLERVADLATNVAEDVIYMIEGEIVRHQPMDQAPIEPASS